jgi:hypothetical protein
LPRCAARGFPAALVSGLTSISYVMSLP